MHEVSYHIAIGFLVGIHKNKAPWSTLPLHIALYEINHLKVVDAEAKERVEFEFNTKEFNLYDTRSICKDKYMIV